MGFFIYSDSLVTCECHIHINFNLNVSKANTFLYLQNREGLATPISYLLLSETQLRMSRFVLMTTLTGTESKEMSKLLSCHQKNRAKFSNRYSCCGDSCLKEHFPQFTEFLFFFLLYLWDRKGKKSPQ